MTRTSAVLVKSVFGVAFFATIFLEGLSYDQIDENNMVSVPKCCPNGEILTQSGCTENGEDLFHPETNVYKHNATHVENNALYPVEYLPYEYNLRCSGFRYALIPDTDNFALLQNGSLLLINSEQLLSPKEYCFERVDVGEETENYLTTALVCDTSGPSFSNHKFLIYFYVIDVVWPVLTIFGYCFVKTDYKIPVIAFTLTVLCRRIIMLGSNFFGIIETCNFFRAAYYVTLLLSFIPLKMISVEVGCTLTKCSQKKRTKNKMMWAFTVSTLGFLALCFFYWDSILGNFLKSQFQMNVCWQEGSLFQGLATATPLAVETLIVVSLSLRNYGKIKSLRTQCREESIIWETLDNMTLACVILAILMAISWGSDISFVLMSSKSVGIELLAFKVIESFEGLIVIGLFAKPIHNYFVTKVKPLIFCSREGTRNRYNSVTQTPV